MSRRRGVASIPEFDSKQNPDKSRKRKRDSSEDMGDCFSKDGGKTRTHNRATRLDEILRDVQEMQAPMHHRTVQAPAAKKAKRYAKPATNSSKTATESLTTTTTPSTNDSSKSCLSCNSYVAKIQALEGEIGRAKHEAKNRLAKMQIEADEQLKKLNKQLIDTDQRSSPQGSAIATLQKKLQKAEEEKQTLLLRVSELAGAKLAAGNPNIVDISDENRATKLAERYSELYDNGWTDAFAALVDARNEDEEAIGKLLNTFMTIFNECKLFAEEDLMSFNSNVLEKFHYDEQSAEATLLRKQYIDRRKKTYSRLEADLKPDIERRLNCLAELERKYLQSFIDESVDLCLLMCVHDPPLDITTDEPNVPFDTSQYKAYTKTGYFVQYIVWPPLRLHTGGPLLAKGIAQGTSKQNIRTPGSRKKRAPMKPQEGGSSEIRASARDKTAQESSVVKGEVSKPNVTVIDVKRKSATEHLTTLTSSDMNSGCISSSEERQSGSLSDPKTQTSLCAVFEVSQSTQM